MTRRRHRVGTTLRRHMEAQGISWREVSAKAGITHGVLSHLFRHEGEKTKLGTLLKICRAVGLHPRDLFADGVPPPATKDEKLKRAQRLLKDANG